MKMKTKEIIILIFGILIVVLMMTLINIPKASAQKDSPPSKVYDGLMCIFVEDASDEDTEPYLLFDDFSAYFNSETNTLNFKSKEFKLEDTGLEDESIWIYENEQKGIRVTIIYLESLDEYSFIVSIESGNAVFPNAAIKCG